VSVYLFLIKIRHLLSLSFYYYSINFILDEQQLQNWRIQAERNFNKQLAKNRLDYDRKNEDRSMRVQPLESNMNKEEIQQWRKIQKQEISEQQEQQKIMKSEVLEQIVFLTAEERRAEEAWQCKFSYDIRIDYSS
jgi:hypothetical protein